MASSRRTGCGMGVDGAARTCRPAAGRNAYRGRDRTGGLERCRRRGGERCPMVRVGTRQVGQGGCLAACGVRTGGERMTGAGALLDTEADDVALAVRDAALLFTDIEGSTLLLQHLGPDYSAVLTRHNDLLRAAIAAAGGSEVSTAGDSFFAIFDTASAALQAAIDAQTRLQAEPWPDGSAVWVRMGIHLG